VHAQYDKYGVHHNTTNPAMPACDVAKGVVCLADSTRVYSDECCMDLSVSEWIVLARAGDSLELFASAHVPAVVDLNNKRQAWQEHDVNKNSASYLRLRIPETGSYRLTVDLDVNLINAQIDVPYELRVHTIPVRKIGAAPFLRIVGDKRLKARIRAIAPRGLESQSDGVPISPGVYRLLAPGIDSIEVCRIPCKTPRAFAVEGPASRTIRP
jgi:hypothetical protein